MYFGLKITGSIVLLLSEALEPKFWQKTGQIFAPKYAWGRKFRDVCAIRDVRVIRDVREVTFDDLKISCSVEACTGTSVTRLLQQRQQELKVRT